MLSFILFFVIFFFFFFFSSRRRHTRCSRDWSSDVCSSDLGSYLEVGRVAEAITHLRVAVALDPRASQARSEEHTSELQSRLHLVCRLLLEKKKRYSDPTTFPHY